MTSFPKNFILEPRLSQRNLAMIHTAGKFSKVIMIVDLKSEIDRTGAETKSRFNFFSFFALNRQRLCCDKKSPEF